MTVPVSGGALMPFGKFKGTPLEELPVDYLCWLAQLDLREPLRRAVVSELVRRVLTPQPELIPQETGR